MTTHVFINIVNEQGHREIVRYDVFVSGLFKQQPLPMMKAHAALGVAGEAGELADAVKKDCIYNKSPDIENIIEELGDLEFYMQAIRNLYSIDHSLVFQHNANKLASRYKGLMYSDEAAIDRADKNEKKRL